MCLHVLREAVEKADMRFSCGGDLVSVPVSPRDASSLQRLSDVRCCVEGCSQNTNIFFREVRWPVLWLVCLHAEETVSVVRKEMKGLSFQPRIKVLSDVFLLWNDTFYRLETSLVAEEQ